MREASPPDTGRYAKTKVMRFVLFARTKSVTRLAALAGFLLCLAFGAMAQPRLIEVGFKGGVPLKNLVTTSGSIADDSLDFTGGGVLQLNLPIGIAIEANALYKRPGYKDTESSIFFGPIESKRHTQWEFPILGKFYPLGRNPLIQPYASAGLSFRRVSTSFFGGNSDAGFVMGAGVRNGPGRVKFSPEIRYPRWFEGPALLEGTQGRNAWQTQNQLEFLVGITF